MEVVRIDEIYNNFIFNKYKATPLIGDRTIEMPDGSKQPLILLQHYRKNSSGEWELSSYDTLHYVTIETLMKNYVIVDSDTVKLIRRAKSISTGLENNDVEDEWLYKLPEDYKTESGIKKYEELDES